MHRTRGGSRLCTRRQLTTLLGLASLSPGIASAKGMVSRAVARIPKPVHYRLENGLEVVLQRDSRQPRVAVLLAYGIGWRDDPRGYAHLAHLVEHMTFRGSRHTKAYEAFQHFERVGARDINGSTGADLTCYHAVVPSEHLALPLWLESERMAFTLEHFDEPSLELERQTVENEIRRKQADFPKYDDHVRTGAFGEEHPYAARKHPLSDLHSIDLDGVRWFFQQGYRPSNAQLVLVGDFEVERASDLVEQYFGPIRNPAEPFRRSPTATLVRLQASEIEFRIGLYQERATATWKAPSPNARDRYAHWIAASVLNHALTAVLREGDRLVSRIGGSYEDYELGSLYHVAFDLLEGEDHDVILERAMVTLRGVTKRALVEGIKTQQVSMIVDELLGQERALWRAFSHVHSLRSTGRPYDLAKEIRRIEATSPDAVVAAYDECFVKAAVMKSKLLHEPTRTRRGMVNVTPREGGSSS